MLFIAILIGCVLGSIVGINAPIISYSYSSYLAIAIIAALDSVFGGIASVINKKFDIKIFNYVDKDDQFVETKEAQLQKVYEESKTDDLILKNFVKKIKTIFYDKYLLNVKKMDVHTFFLENRYYLLDIKNFIFEKFENRHVKLDSEGLYY